MEWPGVKLHGDLSIPIPTPPSHPNKLWDVMHPPYGITVTPQCYLLPDTSEQRHGVICGSIKSKVAADGQLSWSGGNPITARRRKYDAIDVVIANTTRKPN